MTPQPYDTAVRSRGHESRSHPPRGSTLDIALVTPLGLFLSAGAFKGSTTLNWVPFDLTAVGALATAAVCLGLLLREPLPCWKVLLPVLVLAMTFLPAAIWAPSTAYATEKVLRLFTLSALALIAGTIILKSRARAMAFLVILLLFSWVGVGLAIIAPDPDQLGRLAAEGGSTISLGRMAGTAVIIALGGWLYGRSPLLVSTILASVPLYALVASGSRGPLIATAAGLVVLLALANAAGARRLGRTGFLVVGLAVAILVVVVPRVDETAIGRIALLFSADQGASVEARSWLFGEAAGVLAESPLGIGWGGLESVLGSVASYPHNLPLEIGAEGGWLALTIFVSLAVAALAVGIAGRSDATRATIAALVVVHLVNAMVSGDVNSNRLLFALVGSSLALGLCGSHPSETAHAGLRSENGASRLT